MNWAPYLLPPILLLVADALGWIDLSTHPMRRIVKWICAAIVAWLLPTIAQGLFHLKIDEGHLHLWKLIILSVLGICVFTALVKWLWKSYGPVPEGYRRCRKCHLPVVKLMRECPHCRSPL